MISSIFIYFHSLSQLIQDNQQHFPVVVSHVEDALLRLSGAIMTTKEPLPKWVGNTEEWAKEVMLKWGAGMWVTVVWGDWNVLWFTLICVNLTHKSTWIQCSNKSDRLTPHKIGAWDGFSGKSPKQMEWWHKQSVKPSPSCSSVKWWAAEHGHAQQHCSSAWNPRDGNGCNCLWFLVWDLWLFVTALKVLVP